LVLEGELEVTVAGETRTAGPGCVAIVPGDTPHSVRALTSGKAVVANHPVRHDGRSARVSQASTVRGSLTERVHTVVVGAGVVGLAVARAEAMAGREVLILEAE